MQLLKYEDHFLCFLDLRISFNIRCLGKENPLPKKSSHLLYNQVRSDRFLSWKLYLKILLKGGLRGVPVSFSLVLITNNHCNIKWRHAVWQSSRSLFCEVTATFAWKWATNISKLLNISNWTMSIIFPVILLHDVVVWLDSVGPLLLDLSPSLSLLTVVFFGKNWTWN